MANKPYAIEWLDKAIHDIDGAHLLEDAGHYTDTIGYVLHQGIEKTLKAILAYDNQPIIKTHNLVELYERLSGRIVLDVEEVYLLSIATTYQTTQRYPLAHKKLPERDEIRRILSFAQALSHRVARELGVSDALAVPGKRGDPESSSG